jgi:rhamnosyltransferase subunit B
MPRLILSVFGSLGDLHPLIALGRALERRGFTAVIASHAEYADRVAAAGLSFLAVRPSFADLEARYGKDRRALTAELLAHPPRLYTKLILPFLEDTMADLEAALQPDDMLLVTTAAVGARLFSERRGTPWLALALQPAVFLSALDPPRFPPLEGLMALAERLGPRAVQPMLFLVRLALRALGRPITRLRKRLGLAPYATDPILGGAASPFGTLALYSPLFAPLSADLESPVVATGFARFDADEQGTAGLDPALAAFLAHGSAPIVLTLGSSFVWSPGRFYLEGLEAVRALGRRAVLLVGAAAADPSYAALANDDVHVADYAPYSALLPHAAAVVHQGGIGTSAQALAAGCPQLVVPHFGDQMDNARRLEALGVARRLDRPRFDARRATKPLEALLATPSIAARAREWALHIGPENGAATAAEAIETWLSTGRLVAPPPLR